MKIIQIFTGFLCITVAGCKTANESSDQELQGLTPVTVVHAKKGTLTDAVVLNATSSFQIKVPVKSDVNGYLYRVNILPGQLVKRGETLFVIRSKEAEHLGNTINSLDTAFRFSGLVTIGSPAAGHVNQVNCAVGDYVQDGETLVTISDLNSLVFLLELPYELKPYLSVNKNVELTLPDGEQVKGSLVRPLPIVDPVSQTQTFIIHVPAGLAIPENLVANVRYIKRSKPSVIVLPKDAVLTNEVQDEFWIMKMTDSTTAVKIPVKKGLETSDEVEIVSPPLTPDDLILLTGNYGLPDTARVTIKNQQ
jgi:multidrug efflux pump subunit AcrA (membrane-fusion protein)